MLVPSSRGPLLAARGALVINGTRLKHSRGGHQNFIHHGPNVSDYVMRKYQLAREAVAQGRPFIWNIEEHVFDWWPTFEKTLGPTAPFVSCRFVRQGEPDVVKWIVPRFEGLVGQPLAAVSSLQVRRGTVGEKSGNCCDTSAPTVADLLSCDGQLRPMLSHASHKRAPVGQRGRLDSRQGTQHLIFFSEDDNHNYTSDLTRRLSALNEGHGSVHHGDALLATLLRSHPEVKRAGGDVDNYLIYVAFLGIIRRVAAFYRLGLFGLCLCQRPRPGDCARKPYPTNYTGQSQSYNECIDAPPIVTGRGATGCDVPMVPWSAHRTTSRICPPLSAALEASCAE